MNWTQKMTVGLLSAVLLGSPWISVHAESDDASNDTSQGWTPSQANAWMNAQINYARAVKKYGEGSPEATQEMVGMNTLARKLGIKANAEIPQQAPSVPLLDPESDEDADQLAHKGPALNSPAPTNLPLAAPSADGFAVVPGADKPSLADVTPIPEEPAAPIQAPAEPGVPTEQTQNP